VLHARLRRRGVNLPPLTVAVLRLPGEDLAFNRFDQALWSGPAELATGRFTFRAGGLVARLEGELSCAPGDLIRAHLPRPRRRGAVEPLHRDRRPAPDAVAPGARALAGDRAAHRAAPRRVRDRRPDRRSGGDLRPRGRVVTARVL
jgi:hypothetical protein